MDRRYHVDFARHTYRFADQPVDLTNLYFLEEPGDDPAAPRIEAMRPAASLIALVENTYVPRMLDRALRSLEFDQLGRLVERVAVRRIRRHRDPASLPRMCELIVEDMKRGQRAAAAAAVAQP
jgi:hypothetical protein